MERLKPYKIVGIKVGGVVDESYGGKGFSFMINPKNRDLRGVVRGLSGTKTYRIENGNDKYFMEITKGASLNLIYLNEESMKGLYKDVENNLPYEILGRNYELLYRQSITEKKEAIYNRLEKAAIDEGLRK